MADVEDDLPGTWVVQVTGSAGSVGKAIVTFTSAHGLVERFSGNTEGNIGVWEEADDDDRFRFMAFRYIVGPPFRNRRIRATCKLTGTNTFTCTATLDQLDNNENPVGTAQAGLSLNGSRLKLVRE